MALPYNPLIMAAAQRRGVNPAFIAGMINRESSGNAGALGPHIQRMGGQQAGGLMQIMPDTYTELAGRYGLGADRMDPQNNIEAGTAYYAELRKEFGNDADALAAYNWGPGNMRKWISAGRDPNAMPSETRDYVAALTSGGPSLNVQTASGDPLSPMPAPTTINPQAPAMALQQAAAAPAPEVGDMLGGQMPGDLLNVNDVPADDPLAAVRQKAKGQALLDAGAALLGASAWSPRPINMGEALGAGVRAGSAGYQGAMDQAMKDEYMQAQIAAMDRKGGNAAAFLQALGMPVPGQQVTTASGAPAAAGGGAGASGGAEAGPTSLYSKLSEQQQQTLGVYLANGDLAGAEKFLSDLATRESGGKYRDMTTDEKEARGISAGTPAQINENTGEVKTGSGGLTGEQWDRSTKLRGEFQNTTAFKNYNLVAPMYNEIQQAAASGGKGVNDVSTLYAFIKMLDPNSVVREGEVSLTNAASPMAQQAALWYQKVWSGGALTEDAQKQIPQIAARIFKQYENAYTQTADFYKGAAERYGLNADDVLTPVIQGMEEATPPPEGYTQPPAGGSAPAPQQQAPAPQSQEQGAAPPPLKLQGSVTVKQIQDAPVNTIFVDGNGVEWVKGADGQMHRRYPSQEQMDMIPKG